MPNTKKIEKIILKYVNLSRKKRGIPQLKSSRVLTHIARNHSKRMARNKKIWHGNGVHKAIDSMSNNECIIESLLRIFLGFSNKGSCSGENVGLMFSGNVKGFKHKIRTSKDIAKAMEKSWMGSAGHKANILNRHFSKIGVGVVKRKNGYYCTQLFWG